MKYYIQTLLSLLIAVSAISGCTAGSITEHNSDNRAGHTVNGWFDPLSLNDDDIIINGADMPAFSNRSKELSDTSNIDYNIMVAGYRVQVYTTQNISEADSILTLTDSLFNGEAYLQFDAPLYKIRVGNLKSRANAETLQLVTRKKGFPRSWVLRTRVFMNLRQPKEKDSAELLEE
ncbi:MAG: SPOR domain-containing protein [Candidatus Marinimicrobia bacterium]|nr:SPOR domain-containing protein [Candidatus Neomarinimicrobiota bacterium]